MELITPAFNEGAAPEEPAAFYKGPQPAAPFYEGPAAAPSERLLHAALSFLEGLRITHFRLAHPAYIQYNRRTKNRANGTRRVF